MESCKEDVRRIKKKIEKIVAKESDEGQAMDLLRSLKDLPIDFKMLSKTGIGQTVNALRKVSKNEELQEEAKQLIKDWKKAVPKEKSHSSKRERDDDSDDDRRKREKKEKMRFSHIYDEVRAKCCEMISNAITSHGELPDDIIDTPDNLAEQLEEEIFKEMKETNSFYKNRVRSRVHNLKDPKNGIFRSNVLCGNITPAQLARMSAEEMASDDLKATRDRLAKEAMDDAQLAIAEGTRTDLLQCGKCKKRDCIYNQMQTRSADEPMTTFVLCNVCGNRWKFC